MYNPAKAQQRSKSDRRMFSSSDDTAMMKQIQATHAPDGSEVDVKPIIKVIEDIFRIAAPGIDGVINGTQENADESVDKTPVEGFDGILDALAYIINKITCELSCKCSGGADAHTTTMAVFNMLPNYSWEAKVVISLAAFAVNYGNFWLVAQLCNTNPLAKSVSLLKQLPDIIEHAVSLKSRFDAIKSLIKVVLDVTKCIVEFNELPTQYISHETPPMSTAMALIPTASYWTIQSMVACASQITGLLGMSYEHLTSTTEAWELSSLAHKVGNIHGHLRSQLGICYQHIDEKRDAEMYQMLVRTFEMTYPDNSRILRALIYPKDDILPLTEGSNKKRVNIDVLRRKTVLLLISDLDMHHEEVAVLAQIHDEKEELNYEIVWLPIVDRSTPWNEENQNKFQQLQSLMPWYTVVKPSLLEPVVIRYIKEVWHFSKKLMLVALDPQGKVVCPNALHMVMIWGNFPYPFTSTREESLWKDETWRLELLVGGIDSNIPEWIREGKYICLYGGEDIEWIRKFTTKAKEVAATAGISLEMVYVGKSNAKERVKKITQTIIEEKLSSCWPNDISIWFFWTRLESMLFSKTKDGKAAENDKILAEVLTILSFNGSDLGWALISKGSAELARANGETFLKSFNEYDTWEEDARAGGFMPALGRKFEKLHTPQHCSRLILPGINGGIPEKVVCAECGRPMEKYFMYRCCND
ncbi:sieve element occlusion amino-terminus protein [Actinidia rufa]|uniref:Sieve element occlusion amino-terminus protein n=1 Tax=Actinidia rufa TaxID=165716 RepID=A0A7J0DPT7_9ERIC|nr:sieve element occlusion amino-terminus protein [Actinidia rufa]